MAAGRLSRLYIRNVKLMALETFYQGRLEWFILYPDRLILGYGIEVLAGSSTPIVFRNGQDTPVAKRYNSLIAKV